MMTTKPFLYLCLVLISLFSKSTSAQTAISWSTYFGGLDYDEARFIARAHDGSLYVAGSTNSSDHIATPGAFQTIYKGGANFSGSDAFLAKFSSDGTLLWATYYGGENSDLATGLAVDGTGNVYLCGWTSSDTGMATAGSYQPSRASAWAGPDRYDGFLVKFDPSGNRQWATYIGGTSDGFISNPMGLDISPAGNPVLAMTTESTDIAVTAGAAQISVGGGLDGYLICFDSIGARIFATYFGGEGDDRATALTVDNDENILLTGYTESTSGIASAGSQQPAGAGAQDAFLAKFSMTGMKLWSTYCGGADVDRGAAVACDSLGNIFLAGITLSNAGMATPGSYQDGYGGGANGDGFVIRYDPSGVKSWGTYFGGGGSDQVKSMSWKDGHVWIAGATDSNDSIAISDGPQSAFGGTRDGFIARLSGDGSSRTWGTYYGGVDDDLVSSIVIGDSSNIYLCGNTSSATGMATSGAHQQIFAGGAYDGFVAKMRQCQPIVPLIIQTGNRLFTSATFAAYQWHKNGVPIAGATDSFYIVTASGDYSVTVTTPEGCSATSAIIQVDVTGIAEVHAEEIAIYPNPVADKLWVRSGEAFNFQITSIEGQTMLQGALQKGRKAIELKQLPTGLYLLRLTDRNGYALVTKIVKQ